MKITVLAPALLLAYALSCPAPAAEKADLILLHGQIKTGEGGKTVQALAVLGGQIIAVGGDREIQALATAGTQVVDLGGRTATPGLIETDAQVSPGGTPQEIEKAILAHIDMLHRKGVTAVRDVGIAQPQWDAYRALLEVHNLPERVCVTWAVGNTIQSAKTAMDSLGSAPRPPASFGDGRLISCGAYLARDGVDPVTGQAQAKMIREAGFPERSAKGRSAASLLYIDGIAGTLRTGKRADIAIWDKGQCVMTLLDGEVVYSAEEGASPQISKR